METDLKDMGLKAAASGVIAMAGAMLFFGESMNSRASFLGMNIPAPVMVAGASAGGSAVSDVLHNAITSKLPAGRYVDTLTRAGVSGGSTAMLLRGTGAQPGSEINGAVLGGVSTLLGDYVVKQWEGSAAESPTVSGGGGY